MYSDPTLIRRHTVKVRFNEREAALVDALVTYTGEEKAAFIRRTRAAREHPKSGGS